jgi:phage portal protein BeeE
MNAMVRAAQRSVAIQQAAALVPVTKSSASGEALLGATGAMQLQSRTTLTHHNEQYRHYRDEVYALIRTIGNQCSKQPVRVGLLRDPDRERRAVAREKSLGPKERRFRHMRRRAFEVQQKHVLPGSMKAHAGAVEIIEQHPVLDLLARPNPIMRRSTLVFVTVASLELTGKAYWWIVSERDDDGNDVLRLWPVPASWIEPWHQDPAGNAHLFYCYRIRAAGTGPQFEVPPESVVYFQMPDPANPLGAVGPLQAQGRTVVATEAVTESQRRQFENDMSPGLALIIGRHPDVQGVPGERPFLNKDQRSQIIASLRHQYRGVVRHGEPLILDALIQDAKRINPTAREMDFGESGRIVTERLEKGFGVPPTVMGQIVDANRATSTTSEGILCSNVINPMLVLLSETMTAHMQSVYDDDNLLVFFEESHPVNPDDDRARQTLLMANAAMGRNELRAEYGMMPVREGDSCFVPGFGEVPIEIEEAAGSSGRRF